MNRHFTAIVFAATLFFTSSAFAWPCPAGQIRQQAPSGTPVTTPNYDVIEGIAFICVPTPSTSPSTLSTVSSSTSNSSASAASSSSSQSLSSASQKQGQTQGQNQGQTATGGNASANDNGNGSNNTKYNNVNNVEAPKIPVATAYAPTVIPTVTCFKGVGAGVQTMALGGSFGGGRIDENCAILEAARHAPNLLAFCKIYITNKYVKGKVTLDDCLAQPAPISQVEPEPVPPTIVIPSTLVYQQPPVILPVLVQVHHKHVVHKVVQCKHNEEK